MKAVLSTFGMYQVPREMSGRLNNMYYQAACFKIKKTIFLMEQLIYF